MNSSTQRVALVVDVQRDERYARARSLAQQGQHVVVAAPEWARAVDAALRLQLEGLSAEALHLPGGSAADIAAARHSILRRHGHLDQIIGEADSALIP